MIRHALWVVGGWETLPICAWFGCFRIEQGDEVKEDVGDRILRIWPASPERLVQPDTYKSPEEKESALSYAPVAAKQTLSPRHAAVPVVAADAPIRRQIQQLRAGGVRVTYKKGEVNL